MILKTDNQKLEMGEVVKLHSKAGDMKNWKQAKEAYIKDHLTKALANHNIRLNALKKIEKIFSENFSLPLKDEKVFQYGK